MHALGGARSTTMMLATDPVIVRLPASVEAMASASQPACGSGKLATSVRSSITAGTLLTRFESTAVSGDEDRESMQIPRRDRLEQAGRQAGAFGPADDDEQTDEEDQQAPIDFVVDPCAVRRCA